MLFSKHSAYLSITSPGSLSSCSESCFFTLFTWQSGYLSITSPGSPSSCSEACFITTLFTWQSGYIMVTFQGSLSSCSEACFLPTLFMQRSGYLSIMFQGYCYLMCCWKPVTIKGKHELSSRMHKDVFIVDDGDGNVRVRLIFRNISKKERDACDCVQLQP